MRVGLIADTHGLLRPEVAAAFEAVDHIVHAGDVGSPEVLEGLSAIAPVTAVWGNVDRPELRAVLPEVARVTLGGDAWSSCTATSSARPRPSGSRPLTPRPISSSSATPTGR